MTEEIVATTEQPVDTSAVDTEAQARQFGWVPREEFRGSDETWVDADTFVKRGKEINPILRKNNERLMSELQKYKSEMAELKAATEEFKKFQQESFAKKEVELKSQIDDLKKQKKQAIQEGDGDLAVDLDDQIDALKETLQESKKAAVEEKPQQAQQTVPPEVTEWVEKNNWYTSDAKMRSATDALATQLSKDQPWLQGKAFLDALDRELEETFSMDKLGRKTKPRSPVEGGSNSGQRPSSNKKSYENLPADAKAACDKFLRQGIIKSKDEYLAMYDWE